MKNKLIPILLIIIFFVSCNNKKEKPKEEIIPPTPETPVIDYVNINSFPHDTSSFTEGFLVHEGNLWESTGASLNLSQTRSLFGVLDTTTGKIDVKVELDKFKYFGEGICFLNGNVYQLTYQTKVGFVYDAKSFKKIKEFALPTKEGWGMTTNGTELIMSDGTNKLNFLDPNTLKVVKTLSVSENGYALDYLNELEYIKGYIYANLWSTNAIVKIDPADGRVVGRLELYFLAYDALEKYPESLEMNGIAYDSINERVFVTGKMWPKVYEIKFDF